MRRPWIANTLSVLCLLLALGVGGLWAYSHRLGMEVDVHRREWFWGTAVDRGCVSGFWGLRRIPAADVEVHTREPMDHLEWVRDRYRGSFVRFGFAVGGDPSPYYRIVVVPLWLPLLLFATPGVLGVRAWRRRARLGRDPHACRHCGYDCRATPERCPECGHVVSPAARSPSDAPPCN